MFLEMSTGKRVKPSKVVNPGDMVEVEVLKRRSAARRISLGMKQVQDTGRKNKTLPQIEDGMVVESEFDVNLNERTNQAASKEFEETFLQFGDRLGERAVGFLSDNRFRAIAQKYVLSRYHLLINRKHVSGLSPGEIEELESLTQALDEMDEPFYKRVINTLQNLDRSKRV